LIYKVNDFRQNPCSVVESDVSMADTTNLIRPERMHFYNWTVDHKQYLRRGRALVFSQSKENERALKMMDKLRLLEYDPEWKPLAIMDATLESGESKFASIFLRNLIPEFSFQKWSFGN
jgi:hypothetical protein